MAPQILHTGTQNRIAWKAGAREERGEEGGDHGGQCGVKVGRLCLATLVAMFGVEQWAPCRSRIALPHLSVAKYRDS